MRSRYVFLVILVVALILPAALGAESSPWIFTPNARIYGADITVGYAGLDAWPGLPTTLWGHLGGGYQKYHLYRSFTTDLVLGEPMPVGQFPDRSAYWNLTFDGQIGIAQGLFVPGLEVVVLNKYRWDHHYETKDAVPALFDSALADRQGLFVSSFIAALRYDCLLYTSPSPRDVEESRMPSSA